jgi:RNA polymerase sigma factor (sigma-70 family)
MTDGELLTRFLSQRDHAALTVLVERHAPMVWGVCRRILRNHHDSEDAFQATFLVLVHKAATIVPREMVANWLYGVAQQTAVRLRATVAKRGVREMQMNELPEPAVAEASENEFLLLLDQELSRLPERFRVLIVLCDLEGKSRKEVARQLGCPDGTVASGIARARELLAKRLTQRGVVLSSGALATVLAQKVASAGVPVSVVSNTISAASSLTAGSVAPGSISIPVATLTQGVLKAMLLSKLKAVVAVVLLLGFLAAGVSVLFARSSALANQSPATEEKVKAPPRQEPELARPGAALPDLSGTWQGDDWGTVILRPVKDGGFEGTYSDTFGQDVGRIAVRWSSASKRYEGTWSEGKYRFGRIALETPKDGAISGAYTTDPKCEHQPGVPSLASLRWSRKQEKNGFTAWGKEVDGLQAGLMLKGSDAYPPGESVEMEVKLRNVGKAEVKVTHGLLREWPPSVTDAAGVQMTVAMPPHKLYKVRAREEILKPGETITLYNPVIDVESAEMLRLLGELRVDTPTMYVSPGKYKVAYGGMLQSHPTLTTGTVEIVVQEPAKPTAATGESLTAWGKEINGLQAGLGFHPGGKRAYAHGETVTLVVRVRNVGKEHMKFQYLSQFFIETPPTVTDGDGKPVPLPNVTAFGIHLPADVTLAPGKAIELYEWKRELRPAKWLGNDGVPSLYGTGTFGVQYERVFGNSSAGSIKIDPALSKLSTGKLELEIKSAPTATVEKK